MKTIAANIKFILIPLISLFVGTALYAQTDSSKVSFSQENMDSSDYAYKRKYQYLDINMKDETKMFKIALPTFDMHFGRQNITVKKFSLVLSYETKISNSVSVYIDNRNSLYVFGGDYLSFYTELDWGIRYYFLMKKHINRGISGNNLNGLYIDFKLEGLNGISYNSISLYNYSLQYPNKIKELEFKLFRSPDMKVNWGLQKRLNNFSFLDASLYFCFFPNGLDFPIESNSSMNYLLSGPNQSLFSIGLSFKIGLGWGWK